MALQTQQLERTFRYNSVDLIDPGAQYTPEQVRDFYAPTYPEILNAAIEGPDEKDGKLRYTFRRAVGTKGAVTGFEVYAETRLWHNSVALWIHKPDGPDRHVIQPTTLICKTEARDQVEKRQEASLELDRETAINLMTELWRLGYRPHNAQLGGAGEVEATRAHLADLQRLVFRLDVEPRGFTPSQMAAAMSSGTHEP